MTLDVAAIGASVRLFTVSEEAGPGSSLGWWAKERMMNYQEHSRQDWSNTDDASAYPGNPEMQIGCLQRIATAIERLTSCVREIKDKLDSLEDIADSVVPERAAAKVAELADQKARRERLDKRDAIFDECHSFLETLVDDDLMKKLRYGKIIRDFVNAVEDGSPMTIDTLMPIAVAGSVLAKKAGPLLVDALKKSGTQTAPPIVSG